jgi:RNA polymerase sigma-32 factor
MPLGYDQPEIAACGEASEEEMHEAIARLSPREQRVIRLRYFTGRKKPSHRMIGREEGLSKERVRQVEQQALLRLRAFLAEE